MSHGRDTLNTMGRRKQVYKITYPNGKIYIGMDLTGTPTYFGSPSAHEQIVADLDLDPHRFDLTLRKEVLWESETATDAEVRAVEINLILEHRAIDPIVGYNRTPRWRARRAGRSPRTVPTRRECGVAQGF